VKVCMHVQKSVRMFIHVYKKVSKNKLTEDNLKKKAHAGNDFYCYLKQTKQHEYITSAPMINMVSSVHREFKISNKQTCCQ
jgi:hypothetical protein